MLEIKTSSYDTLVYEKVDGVMMMKKDEQGLPIIKETKTTRAPNATNILRPTKISSTATSNCCGWLKEAHLTLPTTTAK